MFKFLVKNKIAYNINIWVFAGGVEFLICFSMMLLLRINFIYENYFAIFGFSQLVLFMFLVLMRLKNDVLNKIMNNKKIIYDELGKIIGKRKLWLHKFIASIWKIFFFASIVTSLLTVFYMFSNSDGHVSLKIENEKTFISLAYLLLILVLCLFLSGSLTFLTSSLINVFTKKYLKISPSQYIVNRLISSILMGILNVWMIPLFFTSVILKKSANFWLLAVPPIIIWAFICLIWGLYLKKLITKYNPEQVFERIQNRLETDAVTK